MPAISGIYCWTILVPTLLYDQVTQADLTQGRVDPDSFVRGFRGIFPEKIFDVWAPLSSMCIFNAFLDLFWARISVSLAKNFRQFNNERMRKSEDF